MNTLLHKRSLWMPEKSVPCACSGQMSPLSTISIIKRYLKERERSDIKRHDNGISRIRMPIEALAEEVADFSLIESRVSSSTIGCCSGMDNEIKLTKSSSSNAKSLNSLTDLKPCITPVPLEVTKTGKKIITQNDFPVQNKINCESKTPLYMRNREESNDQKQDVFNFVSAEGNCCSFLADEISSSENLPYLKKLDKEMTIKSQKKYDADRFQKYPEIHNSEVTKVQRYRNVSRSDQRAGDSDEPEQIDSTSPIDKNGNFRRKDKMFAIRQKNNQDGRDFVLKSSFKPEFNRKRCSGCCKSQIRNGKQNQFNEAQSLIQSFHTSFPEANISIQNIINQRNHRKLIQTLYGKSKGMHQGAILSLRILQNGSSKGVVNKINLKPTRFVSHSYNKIQNNSLAS